MVSSHEILDTELVKYPDTFAQPSNYICCDKASIQNDHFKLVLPI